VFHLAAATHGDWEEYQRVTIEGSARLLEAMAARGGRLVFVSSLSVYDDCAMADGAVVDEEAPIAAQTAARGSYARAKSAADGIAQKYLQGRGLRLTIVRPGIVYGPGMKNPLTGVAMSLGGLGWVATGDRRKLLPLIYIDDLIGALILIAERTEAVGKIFNLVQSEQPTHRAYLALYRQVSGDRRPVLRLPLRASVPVLRALDWTLRHLRGKDSQMAQTARRLTGRIVYSAQRARRELGFEPATPITAGLRNAVARD
jgi:nucleoside-diphosphate-sugar epimerase